MDLAKIILITGPSGSGKSTFLREFLSGGLAGDLRNCVPDETKSWKSISSNEVSRKGLPSIGRASGGRPGLWVHYDIMRPFTKGFEHYANDPALQAVMAANAVLTVINLLPSREILFDQFLTRVWNDSYAEPWEKKRFSTRRLRLKLRKATFALTGKRTVLLKEGHVRLLGVYACERRLEQWTSRWEDFLASMRRDRSDIRIIDAAPAPTDGSFGFRALSRV